MLNQMFSITCIVKRFQHSAAGYKHGAGREADKESTNQRRRDGHRGRQTERRTQRRPRQRQKQAPVHRDSGSNGRASASGRLVRLLPGPFGNSLAYSERSSQKDRGKSQKTSQATRRHGVSAVRLYDHGMDIAALSAHEVVRNCLAHHPGTDRQ